MPCLPASSSTYLVWHHSTAALTNGAPSRPWDEGTSFPILEGASTPSWLQGWAKTDCHATTWYRRKARDPQEENWEKSAPDDPGNSLSSTHKPGGPMRTRPGDGGRANVGAGNASNASVFGDIGVYLLDLIRSGAHNCGTTSRRHSIRFSSRASEPRTVSLLGPQPFPLDALDALDAP